MKISEIQTTEELEALGIGRLHIDISHRGGGLGFHSSDIARHFEINESDLPRYFGAGCNYLGGGLRGSIFPSGYSKAVIGKTAKKLDAIAAACVRVYENLESETGVNDETYEDGDINWDAIGTRASRAAGVESGY